MWNKRKEKMILVFWTILSNLSFLQCDKAVYLMEKKKYYHHHNHEKIILSIGSRLLLLNTVPLWQKLFVIVLFFFSTRRVHLYTTFSYRRSFTFWRVWRCFLIFHHTTYGTWRHVGKKVKTRRFPTTRFSVF